MHARNLQGEHDIVYERIARARKVRRPTGCYVACARLAGRRGERGRASTYLPRCETRALRRLYARPLARHGRGAHANMVTTQRGAEREAACSQPARL